MAPNNPNVLTVMDLHRMLVLWPALAMCRKRGRPQTRTLLELARVPPRVPVRFFSGLKQYPAGRATHV